MCLYRDTYGDRLWRIVPYDMNASWASFTGSSPLEATTMAARAIRSMAARRYGKVAEEAWNRIL